MSSHTHTDEVSLLSYSEILGSSSIRTQECKDTDVALEIVAQTSSDQVVGLLLLAQTIEGQALHGQGLCRERGDRDRDSGG